MRETKVQVPHPSPDVGSLCGILAQQQDTPTAGKPLALILHGVLAHKDQIYHKPLVAALPIDSFRFDFHANAESPGTWDMAGFESDILDIKCVVDFLRSTYGYSIEVVIAHSRGAIDAFAYFHQHAADTALPQDRIPYFVALAPRFNMERIHDRDSVYKIGFDKEGVWRWKVKVAGQPVEVQVTPAMVQGFATWPAESHVRGFPTKTDCLFIQGTADPVVPVSDAAYFANILTAANRRPGSFHLHLIDRADHNFKGHFDELISTITTWLNDRILLAQQGAGAGAIRDAELRAAQHLQSSWDQQTKGKL